MNEHVLPAAIRSDETIAPIGVEPFHRAGLLDRWAVRCRRLRGTRPSRHQWSGGAAVDTQHLGDVWSLVTGTDPHFEGFARLNSGDAEIRMLSRVVDRSWVLSVKMRS